MKRWGYWAVIGAVLLALVALIGWSSTYTPLLTPRASEEWSRGRLLGVTPVNVRVDIQPAPDGGVFLTWADLDDRLRLVRLGTRGQVVVDRTLALGTGVPRTPRFLVGPGGEIHLIWREADAGHSRLAYARLSGEGSVQVGPLALSPPGDEVKAFDLAFNRQGGIEVFWAGGAGVYRVTVNTEGETLGEPALLVEGGESINLQVDQAGIFHLAWIQKVGSNTSAIYYSSFDPEQETLGQPEEMGRVFLRTGQSLQDVVVGVDSDTGYVLWIIQDLKAISSSGRYVFFPLEIPRQKRIRSVRLNDGANPLSPWPVRGQYETLLVALTETIMTSDGPQLQVAIVALHGEEPPATYASAALQSRGSTLAAAQDDWPEDQAVVTASDRPSLKPSLAVDAQHQLHLTWLETGGFGIYRVAYASTVPEIKEAYNALTLWDVTNWTLGVAMQLFMAVGLTPVLGISWSLFPLMWLLLYHLVTGQEHLTRLSVWGAFGVSVLLEIVCTYLIYPYRGTMPSVLQWTGPLITAAVALLLTAFYLYKRDERPLFGAFFVFALTHGLLQVMFFIFLRR